MPTYKGLWVIALLIIFTSLSGCESAVWDRLGPPPQPTHAGMIAGATGGAVVGGLAGGGFGTLFGAALGADWGAFFGNVIEAHQSLVDYLMYNGINVVQVGDEIKLVLPSDRFYYRNSPNLDPAYYRILRKVAEFIRDFKKVSVEIAAYTDDTGSWRRNLSLTRQQALNMENFLWLCGVDTRLLYTVGYGDADPIATNQTLVGRRYNRRIEISLRKIEPEPLV